MPGLLKENYRSSSSESLSSSENEISTSTEQSSGGHEYAAASYPGYSEKSLTEQLEPIAVCGMGKLPQNALDPD